MKKINNLFDQQITSVVEAFPSIYTKDDVIQILSSLRTQTLYEAAEALSEANKASTGITEEQFQEFANDVQNNLERSICDGSVEVYDTGSAEFSIGYDNRVQIENIDVLTDNINDELHDILLDRFKQHFGNLITDESSDNS